MRRPRAVPWIVALNIGVFILWSWFGPEPFMVNNFLVSWDALLLGRYWTLVSSAFSHNLFFHLFINMYVFFGFGMALEMTLGLRRFAIFYLIAGAVSSLSHCLVSAYFLGQPDLPALGASGAISGVVVVFSLLYPKEKIFLFGLIPLPAIWGAVLAVGLDLWGLSVQAQGGGLPIGYGAHLGGALAGVIHFLMLRRQLSTRRYAER